MYPAMISMIPSLLFKNSIEISTSIFPLILCWVYFLENALDGVEKNSKDDWHKEWNYHYLHSYWIDRVASIKWSEGEIENGYFSIERMMMIFNRWRRMEYKSKNTFSSHISIHFIPSKWKIFVWENKHCVVCLREFWHIFMMMSETRKNNLYHVGGSNLIIMGARIFLISALSVCLFFYEFQL